MSAFDEVSRRRVRKTGRQGLGFHKFTLFNCIIFMMAGPALPWAFTMWTNLDIRTAALMSIGIMFLIGLLLYLAISKGLFQPISRILEASNRLLEGDISAKSELDDKFGPLEKVAGLLLELVEKLESVSGAELELETVRKEIESMTSVIRTAASGDLSVNASIQGDMANLGDRLSELIRKNRLLAEKAQTLVSAVEQGAGAISNFDDQNGSGMSMVEDASALALELVSLKSQAEHVLDGAEDPLAESVQRLGIISLNLAKSASRLESKQGIEIQALTGRLAAECAKLRESLNESTPDNGISRSVSGKIASLASKAGTLAKTLEKEFSKLDGLSASVAKLLTAASELKAELELMRLDGQPEYGENISNEPGRNSGNSAPVD
ncbi:MAG: hypothetical protein GXP49_04200 [Deltaproteobacteria bacterium]|nr:hypothetical protein [Deltaproteobacteria bacterium]